MAESFFSRFPAPPCAQLLGWELIADYPGEGRIEIAFHPTAQMLNPRGTVQGGFVAAMLDDTMGPALVSMTGGAEVPASIDLNVSFLKPVMPGRVIGKGRVVGRGRSVAFLEAELFDEKGELLARATSSARIMEFDRNAS
ncbi:PaaI family thioesterase [Sphingopyxis granuli]|uniref:Phenylacetic acid degradation protein n=1 Tax=Sphingopyxis granuli TaxID=267128 RepID=A0AA86L5F4_9SPHN|nr:PaaI family thioesterase [Sphingopyxis granuli]AMG75742.1 Phenylacetic acid degradation protein [Sphingopyxis granuli]